MEIIKSDPMKTASQQENLQMCVYDSNQSAPSHAYVSNDEQFLLLPHTSSAANVSKCNGMWERVNA